MGHIANITFTTQKNLTEGALVTHGKKEFCTTLT